MLSKEVIEMKPANEVRITKDGRIFIDGLEFLPASSVQINIIPDTLFEIAFGTYEWSRVVENRFGKEKVWHANPSRPKTSPEARYLSGGGISFGGVKFPGGYYFLPSERSGELLIYVCAYRLNVDDADPPYSGECPEWRIPRIRDSETKWNKNKKIMGDWFLPTFVAVATTIAVRWLLNSR